MITEAKIHTLHLQTVCSWQIGVDRPSQEPECGYPTKSKAGGELEGVGGERSNKVDLEIERQPWRNTEVGVKV